jgi:hypothetical protein
MKSVIKGRLTRALLVLAGSLLAYPASAQSAPKPDSVQDSDGWAPVKHLTFTDDEIQGGVFAPDGERIDTVLRASHPSLIELRRGFEAEIVKTLEDM